MDEQSFGVPRVPVVRFPGRGLGENSAKRLACFMAAMSLRERTRVAALCRLFAFETSLWHIPVSTIHCVVGDLTGCKVRRIMTARNIICYVAVPA